MKNDKKNKKVTGQTVTGEPKTEIDVRPTDVSIREEVILTFGRFNPPTVGHQRLVEYMRSLAEDTSDVKVYLSHRHDNKKNLLEYETKLTLCKEAFGDCVVDSDCQTIMEILTSLSGKYKNVTVVVGSDRELDFAERLPLYNGDLYEFEDIFVCGFERSDDDISSTKMRQFVAEDKDDDFYLNLPSKIRHHYADIRESLLSLADQRSADFKMVKVLTPLGKWIWRKEKRDQNVMNNKQSLAVSTQKLNRPKNMIKKFVVGEEKEPMSKKIGQFTKKQKQFQNLQTDEEAITELSQRSVLSYFNKAATDRGKAEAQGDTKRLKKRDQGLTSAINRSHKWWGKR